jgi:plastocyanin
MSFVWLRPFALLGLLLTACTSSIASPTATGGAAPAGTAASDVIKLGNFSYADHGTRDASGKSEFELEADSFYFGPTFLKGTPGQKLKLEIENEVQTTHNFSLSAQQIDKDIPGKGKVEVEVTFPQSGALRFFCKFHTGQGMNGQLLVGNATPQALQ